MLPAEHDRLVAVLTRAARFGTYFEARLEPEPLPEFDIPATLAVVGRRLGTTEARVAASSLQYEFAERLWSIMLGAWAFGRVVPDLSALCYTAVDGVMALGFADLYGWNCLGVPPQEVADTMLGNVIPELHRFHDDLRATVKVADGLLWGNAATALVLAGRSADRARSPAVVIEALLAQPPLAGRLTGPVTGPLRRRSCCLYYRARAGRMCSDCPLPRVPA